MKVFNFIAGCCSIVSLLFSILFLFLKNETCAWIALAFFCVFLLILIVSIIWTFVHISQKATPEGYVMDFAVISYDVVSEQVHKHDLFKIIQSKRPFLYSIDHGFSWSGTKTPVITSELQEIGKLRKAANPNEFDQQELVLRQPLLYNQTTTAHFHADLDNADSKAEPYLAFSVRVPMSMIYFNVILRNKPEGYSKNAIVEKIPNKEGPLRKKETIKEVSFDSVTHSYTCLIPNPEAGYCYKISWEK